MIDVDTIYTTLDDIYGSNNVLNTLVEFERVFDQIDLYVYKNWLSGEVVEGPKIDRYWITVTLMYPYKLMPDPDGAMRLIDHGCKVWYSQDILHEVGRVSYSNNDERTEPEPKIIKSKVWLVKIAMPRHFVDDIDIEKIEVGGTSIDMDDVTDAYDEDLTGEEAAKGNAADNEAPNA